MAQNKTDLITLINANITDNTAAENTAAGVREVNTQIMDSALNTVEPSLQTVAGEVDYTGNLKKAGLPVVTSVKERDFVRTFSTAASQVPAGLGVALQIEFGPAQSTTKMSLAANGAVTCNVTGTYAFRFKLQKGRTGASGTSILMSRITINGLQVGISSAARMTSSDQVFIIDSRVVLEMTAGDVLRLEIIRDSAGTNFGGLFSVSSSHGWNLSPTALLVISEVVGE